MDNEKYFPVVIIVYCLDDIEQVIGPFSTIGEGCAWAHKYLKGEHWFWKPLTDVPTYED